MNENEDTTHQNVWDMDTAKLVFRGKFIVVYTYAKKERKVSNQYPNLLS